MLRNEFPVTLQTGLEVDFLHHTMDPIPFVCRSKYTVCRAPIVRHREDLVLRMLTSDFCAHYALPLYWIRYRSVSSRELRCLGRRIEAANKD